MPEPEDLIIEDEPEITPEPEPEPAKPEPLTDEQRLEIARDVAQKNPDALSHYFTPPPHPHDAPKPKSDEPKNVLEAITNSYGDIDPDKLLKFMEDRDSKTAQTVLQGVTGLLAPVMQSFATQNAVKGLPEEAVPYAEEIATKLGVPLYQAAQDRETMDFVRSAAIGKAYQAGKLKVELPESGEPVGGGSNGTFNTTEAQRLAEYAKITGSTPTRKEAEELRKAGLLG